MFHEGTSAGFMFDGVPFATVLGEAEREEGGLAGRWWSTSAVYRADAAPRTAAAAAAGVNGGW